MKPLLILDLDETLVHATTQPPNLKHDFEFSGYFVFLRPHLEQFLTTCAAVYDIAIWSSASDDYVQGITDQIFPGAITPKFVWGRSRCTPRTRFQLENEGFSYSRDQSYYEYCKVLKKVKRKGFDLKRTLIVDDTPSKVRNAYGNAIYILPFEAQGDDDELLLLADYLLRMHENENMRAIEKRGWRTQIRNAQGKQ